MSGRKTRKHSFESTTDVNIVPIVDCMVVLITFSMAAGTFLSIGALQVGVSTSAQQEQITAEKDPVQIFVDVQENRSYTVRVTGDENYQVVIPPARSNTTRVIANTQESETPQPTLWDYGRLSTELQKLAEKWPKIKSATVAGHPEILYQDLVSAMEKTRLAFPDVVLGGF